MNLRKKTILFFYALFSGIVAILLNHEPMFAIIA